MILLRELLYTYFIAKGFAMLEREINFFTENKDAWLEEHPQKFVLVRGDKLIGVFDTLSDALTAGSRMFGLDHFLIRQVTEREDEIRIPAFSLGILRADSTSTISG